LRQALHQVRITVVVELEILDEVVLVFPVAQYNGANVLVAIARELDAALVNLLVWCTEEFVSVIVALAVVVWRADLAVLHTLLHHAELMAVLCAVGLGVAVVCVEAVFNLTLVCSTDVCCEIHAEEIIPRSSSDDVTEFASERAILRVWHTSETVWWADFRIWIESCLLSERRWPLVAVLVVSQFVGEVLTERETTADTRATIIIDSAARFMAIPDIFSVVATRSNEGDFVRIRVIFVLKGQLV
jgi:hypothetical protein